MASRKRKTDWFGQQIDLLRALYRKHKGNRDRCVEEFAAAGERGDIIRKSNVANQTWLHYARFKFEEADRKGWLLTRGTRRGLQLELGTRRKVRKV